jgi:ABC-2 type transport system ATP-binding protein
MNDRSVIYTEKLTKRYETRAGGVTAVEGVSLAVGRGETFGLIGPDGAGKTTLVRVLLGLLARTAGESRVLGYDSMREPFAIRERAGYIAQRFALPGDMTVLENLRFFAGVNCVSRQDQRRRIPELLEFAGLTQFTGRQAGRLSGGMKKKLALACSLIHDPDVVLLDEPTLGVDPVSRREFWNLLGNLRAERGLTILVCTPYMDEAERCNRVGLMYRGQLVAYDTPSAVKRCVSGHLLEFTPSQFVPAHRLVAGLEGVLEVQTYGMMLHAFVDNPALRRLEIEAALAAEGITCSGMREIEPRMEQAFISLVSREAQKQT